MRHLKNFVKEKTLPFSGINRVFCQKFAEYLQSEVTSNSAYVYYSLFKAVLNIAVKEDLINKNPANGISIKKTDTNRNYLTIEELKLLFKTPKTNLDTCNAFLFACFTGLRISDLKKLTFEQIKDGYIEFRTQKTGQFEKIMLTENALQIIDEQANFKRSENVFKILTAPRNDKYLHEWIRSAGIDKHITFHCSRHTMAVMCITYDVDLFSVSKLLGHKSVKTTQIYAKLIDKKKDEAIAKLPVILK